MVLEVSSYLSTNWQEITTFDGSSMSHTVTVIDDALVAYEKYRFRIKSVNDFGSSDYSAELAAAVSPLPSIPDPVSKVQDYSTDRTITVSWAEPPIYTGEVSGFQLFMTDFASGTKTMVYDGQRNPNNLQYTVYSLEPGQTYGFTVIAYNFNGAGEESEITLMKPCTLPSGLSTP
jgi:hypothetical protein